MSKNIDPDVAAALAEAAEAARASSYAPYSKFRVGAALLDDRGELHKGCNVENAAYPEGVCAEAAAISAMILAGGRQIKAIAVAGPGPDLCTPCGGCRQKIREFAAPETPVILAGPNGIQATLSLAELLPHAFGPENLD